MDGLTPETRFPAMLIEVRDYATANRAASKISEISLKEQRVLSGQIIEDTVASTDEADLISTYPITVPPVYQLPFLLPQRIIHISTA